MLPWRPTAGEWPDHPIHFIVPFPAGGSTDVAARVVGDYLSHTLGQQVVIENKSGANGNIGIEYVAKSAPDGYTILIGTDAVSSNPHVYKMDIDPLKDLVPVIELSRQPIALAANPSLGVTTLAQLTELVKKQPGLGFATGSGAGSLQAMVGLWYAKLAGITLEQVPYRGGGQAINDLVAGHIKLGSLGTTPLVPYYKTGGLNLLAQSMAKRSPALPDVPTFQEAGLTDLVVDQRPACSYRSAPRPRSPPVSTPRSTRRWATRKSEKSLAIRRKNLPAAQPSNTPGWCARIPTNTRGW